MRTLTFKDQAYRVLHIVFEGHVENLEKFKKNIQHDLLLRERGRLWFLEHIPDGKFTNVESSLIIVKKKRTRNRKRKKKNVE